MIHDAFCNVSEIGVGAYLFMDVSAFHWFHLCALGQLQHIYLQDIPRSLLLKKNPKNLYPQIWDYLSSDNSTTFSISIWSHSVSGNSNDRLTTFNLIGVSKVITSDYNTRVQNRGHVQRSRWKLPTASEITTRRKIGKRTENYPRLMMQGELEEIMNNSWEFCEYGTADRVQIHD